MALRRHKPTALKLLMGNPGRRPLPQNEPQPRKGTPQLPKWLRAFPAAVKEWRREARELAEMGVLTHAEAGDLAMRAYIGAQIPELAEEIRVEGRVIQVKKLNRAFEEVVVGTRTNPKCVQLAKLLAEYRAIGSLLGLDPSSRARIKVDKPKPQSRVESFMGRKHVAQK